MIERNELGYEVLMPESDKYGIGKRFVSNEGCPFEIVRKCDIDSNYRWIVFYDNYGAEVRVNITQINRGSVSNPYFPSVFNRGYMGVGKHKSRINNENRREYKLHSSMMARAYNPRYHEKQPTYKGVIVDEKLWNYQEFCNIVHNIPFWNMKDEEGHYYEMDKDIFSVKMYSKETIVFIPKALNSFFTNRQNSNGGIAAGVHFHKNKGKYIAQINIDGKRTHLGAFEVELQAYEVYCNARDKKARELAEKYKGKIEDRVYNVLINWNEKYWSGYTCKELVEKANNGEIEV